MSVGFCFSRVGAFGIGGFCRIGLQRYVRIAVACSGAFRRLSLCVDPRPKSIPNSRKQSYSDMTSQPQASYERLLESKSLIMV